MSNYTEDELHEAVGPIASLISKSEKAKAKMSPGTWQHKMLLENLKALRHAYALMKKDSGYRYFLTDEDAEEFLRAFSSMINRTEKAQVKYLPGTSQHTLLKNRLNALRMGKTLIKEALDKG